MSFGSCGQGGLRSAFGIGLESYGQPVTISLVGPRSGGFRLFATRLFATRFFAARLRCFFKRNFCIFSCAVNTRQHMA